MDAESDEEKSDEEESDEDETEDEDDNNEEEKNQKAIHYVVGDVTKPTDDVTKNKDVIIVHCVGEYWHILFIYLLCFRTYLHFIQ